MDPYLWWIVGGVVVVLVVGLVLRHVGAGTAARRDAPADTSASTIVDATRPVDAASTLPAARLGMPGDDLHDARAFGAPRSVGPDGSGADRFVASGAPEGGADSRHDGSSSADASGDAGSAGRGPEATPAASRAAGPAVDLAAVPTGLTGVDALRSDPFGVDALRSPTVRADAVPNAARAAARGSAALPETSPAAARGERGVEPRDPEAIAPIADGREDGVRVAGIGSHRDTEGVPTLEADASRVAAERAEHERLESERLWTEFVEAQRVQAGPTEAPPAAMPDAAAAIDERAVDAESADSIGAGRSHAEAIDAAASAQSTQSAAGPVEADGTAVLRVEAERFADERSDAGRSDTGRIDAERIETERIETERIATEHIATERIAAERLEGERIESERIEAARVQAAHAEAVRVEAERRAALAAAPTPGVPPAIVPPTIAPKKPNDTLILVADDSKIVRVKTGRLLERHQYRVAFAVDGLDAMRQLEGQVPDVVITDVDMPGLDGFELTRKVRANPLTANVPVIVITAADDRHRDDAERAGVSVLLGKPYPEDELIDYIRSVMAGGEATFAESTV